jgi:hypothetical protein
MLVHRERRGVRVLALAAAVCAALVSAPLLFSAPASAATGTGFRFITTCKDDDGTVAVRVQDQSAGDGTDTFQIGFGDQNSYPAGGGPTQLSLSPGQISTVHLAGKFDLEDFITVQDSTGHTMANSVIASTCPASIHDVSLKDPLFTTYQKASCSSTAPPADQAVILAGMQSFSSLSESYKNATGLDSIPYTVSLVDTSGKVMQTHMFDFQFIADADSFCFTAPASVSATYQVRAVAVDGTVVAHNVTVSKSSVPPTKPTPTPTPTKPHGNPHPSSPAPSSSAANHSTQNSQTSQSASATGAAPPPSVNTGAGQAAGGTSSSAAGPVVSSSPSASKHPSSSAPKTEAAPSPSVTTVAPTQLPGLSDSEPTRLAEPPLDNSSRIFVWQRDAALIVLLDTAAIGALIGGVIWGAKRR